MSKEFDGLKDHIESEITKARKENMEAMSVTNLKIERVNDSVVGLEKTMNGRIKKLEISEAERRGAERVSRPLTVNWGKLLLAIVSVLGAAIALATTLAQILAGRTA